MYSAFHWRSSCCFIGGEHHLHLWHCSTRPSIHLIVTTTREICPIFSLRLFTFHQFPRLVCSLFHFENLKYPALTSTIRRRITSTFALEHTITMDSPLCNKKRTLDEVSGTKVYGSEFKMVWDEIEKMKTEIERLKQDKEIMTEEIEKLKSSRSPTVEDNEESSDDEESDDESVCDGSPFSKNYSLLKQYKQENGDCKVPQKQKPLGKWVDNTRSKFKNKKLSQDKIDKLNKIGFYWGKGHPEPATWEDRLEELQKYQETFGHCNVPVHSDPTMMTDLAKWVAEQRKQGRRLRKQRASSMTMEQFKTLNEMGFVWKPKNKKRKSD